ncbi:hypothetical protein IJI28_02285 [Candidatus Saccharibacteria bacterium]|nr:hypothetical protein [Candidatus Saccharibacteria bacterium]
MHKTKLIMLLLTITLLSGITLASTKASADTDSTDTISLTVPIACTMTGENTSHTATLDPGTYSGATGSEYENGIGKTTLTAICNDDNGFSIYAIGYTSNQYEGENHTKLIGQSTNSAIATKAYASGDTTSNWSMKLIKITDATVSYNPQNLTIQSDTEGTFSNWHSVPDTYTKVAEYHANTGSSTTDTTLGVKLETTYAAYISSSQPADTYVGQVKYTMVHPYDAAAPEGPMGLCQDSDTCMQQQTTASLVLKLPNVGDTTTLYDARDNQAYTVAKLADGKYWMTENLNIAGGTALSSEDTDFESTYTLPTTNGWTATDGKLVLPASSISGFSNNNYAYVYNSGNKTSNCSSSSDCYSYYSWDAATLGSGRAIAAENTDAPYSICPKNWRLPTSGATSSEGWKRGDFHTLATNYGANLESDYKDSSSATGANFYNNAGSGTTPNFLLAGYYYSRVFTNGGSNGYYWSSTSTSNSSNARYLFFSSSYVNSANGDGRKGGYSVRCLFGS